MVVPVKTLLLLCCIATMESLTTALPVGALTGLLTAIGHAWFQRSLVTGKGQPWQLTRRSAPLTALLVAITTASSISVQVYEGQLSGYIPDATTEERQWSCMFIHWESHAMPWLVGVPLLLRAIRVAVMSEPTLRVQYGWIRSPQ